MAEHTQTRAVNQAESTKLLGYLVEFEDTHALFHACEKLRDSGYKHWDAYTPYPVHGLNDAMGLKPSRLPYLVLGGGLTGMALALAMQWWMNAIDYPYLISGKPIFSLPANVPVIFELTVLLAAFGAFFGMLVLNRLPRFHHPVFTSARIERATDDRFFISLEATDPLFSAAETRQLAESLGGTHIEPLEEAEDEAA